MTVIEIGLWMDGLESAAKLNTKFRGDERYKDFDFDLRLRLTFLFF